MAPWAWGVSALALIAALVGVVAIEIRLHADRRRKFDREATQWRLVQEQIVQDLADPARQEMVAEAVERAKTSKEHLNQVCRTTSAALHAPAAVVKVIERDGQHWLAYYGAEWIDQGFRDGLLAPLNTSYGLYVVATNAPLAIEDSLKDPRVTTTDEATKRNIRSYLGVPVYGDHGGPIGTLCVFDFKPRRWNARDETTLRSYASLVRL